MGASIARLFYRKGKDRQLSTFYNTQLVKLHQTYREKGFEILAFPCNQFMKQEPKTNQEIKTFLQTKFNVEFPLFDKVDVNGENAHDIYKYLRINTPTLVRKEKNDIRMIPWNFSKFLVDSNGKVVGYFDPSVQPRKLRQMIENMLDSSD
ncbi:glutathione peroxidase family protein [Stylonychia lemnae]|uniref:Glutathione peroxidase n=1 Tax=Stylonychia lemnae TaxID=5949 RepID=A0A078B6P4_STYLE|nr:glutathione peroxidase family protein [Stylonychia lemnae]|eukprot:CDW90044.1 glutathione peroxidase family protein [Stylonychia lemnae]